MNNKQTVYWKSMLGWLEITATTAHLMSVKLVSEPKESSPEPNSILEETVRQLEEYFAGKRKIFDLPMQQEGTPFQQKIWEKLLHIPFGKSISYKVLAEWAGCPKGCRAVGNANGKNNICIIVPCHRVIQSDGKTGGYAYGTEMKEALLLMENTFSQEEK